jgi:hypothetical protein
MRESKAAREREKKQQELEYNALKSANKEQRRALKEQPR